MQLPDQLISDTPYLTAELWFRTTGSGVLLSYQDHTLEEATPGKNTPAIYVGTDGKLRGEFWNGVARTMWAKAPRLCWHARQSEVQERSSSWPLGRWNRPVKSKG
ncbi:hypothetical protein OG242_19415 [Streptomyces sp. NBC_00727]|uniref:hypothetical protein n=1 Tax=Streptomyces sp. NBC_00727 TaxID=2903675 RepID=UPI00386E14EA